MNLQIIFLDAGTSNVDEVANTESEDFLVTNLNEFKELSSILITSRESFRLEALNISSKVKIIKPNAPTRGALATALLAIDLIPSEKAIVLIPTNSHLKNESLIEFLQKMISGNYSAGTVCVRSTNPNYSYIRVFNGKIIEVIEKKIFGELATTGIFYFSSKNIFVESARWAFVNNQTTNSIFYIAPCLNFAICKGFDIGYHVVDNIDYVHASWASDNEV